MSTASPKNTRFRGCWRRVQNWLVQRLSPRWQTRYVEAQQLLAQPLTQKPKKAASPESPYPFAPSGYLTSLIAALNDGAKAAQASALLFMLVGVYQFATAFSASDEDLLLGRAVTFPQIGMALPVGFSFGVAPIVFVFLHVYTLIRYDMLAGNVRQFLTELRRTVPSHGDRERCRQLLANAEFVQALVSPPAARSYSRLWRWLVLLVVGVFPIFVLIVVQINSLRKAYAFASGEINIL